MQHPQSGHRVYYQLGVHIIAHARDSAGLVGIVSTEVISRTTVLFLAETASASNESVLEDRRYLATSGAMSEAQDERCILRGQPRHKAVVIQLEDDVALGGPDAQGHPEPAILVCDRHCP